MSQDNTTKPPVYSDEQRRAIVTKMFQNTHSDLGAITKILTGNPTPEGFLIPTEVTGEAIVRLTRAMAALEKLIAINIPKDAAPSPTVGKDGAIIAGTWSTTPAPPDDGKPVMTASAMADAAAKELLASSGKSTLVSEIKHMTVGTIQEATAKLVVPGTEGTESVAT